MTSVKVILLVAHEGYQPIEYGITKEILKEAGMQVLTASDKPGTATSRNSSTTHVDLTCEEIDPEKIDGLFLIGGPGALEHLDTPLVYSLVQEMMSLGKPYGAICIASRILAKAGVLGGKKATGWDGDKELTSIFQEHAVTYKHEPVTIDGTVVTATDPAAAERFGKALVKVLKKFAGVVPSFIEDL